MTRLLFYDIAGTNFSKYIPDLLEELNRKKKFQILLAYEEDPNDYGLKFLSKFKTKKVGLLNRVDKLVMEFNPDVVVVNAQRIPDSFLVSYCNSLGIKTVMIQHGMYNGFLKRETSLFISKIYKSFKYFIYVYRLSKVLKVSMFTLLKQFTNTFIKGMPYKNELSSYDLINTKKIMVYGDYWIKYHVDYFGYNSKQSIVVGYPELKKSFLQKEAKDGYCYIAQTLVEDGRMSKEMFDEVISFLQNLSKDNFVTVKLHPRSNKDLYRNLNIVDILPSTINYIGHYSSLLAIPIYNKRNVFLLPLKNHNIPDYFQKSCLIYDDWRDYDGKIPEIKNKLNLDISNVFSYPIDLSVQIKLLCQ